MVNDLLFSVLPREGKEPIAHDTQKIEKIDKIARARALKEEDEKLKGQQQDPNGKKQNQAKQDSDEQTAQKDDTEQSQDTAPKKPKGPKHLDVYV
ncbi:hypothetical protein [Paraglaciecola sp. 2405UD69-4]|uniref:hypothetical protein n=1 Tax=Paraglaciecola sp. 2405UD69-4 TaxID=3391836 RepID=UPI0039C95248